MRRAPTAVNEGKENGSRKVSGSRWSVENSTLLAHAEARDGRFGVMGETDPVDAIEGLELARSDDRRLVDRRDDLSVNRALDLVALDREGDLLLHRLADARRLGHGAIRSAAADLERCRTEAAGDERAVAIGRAVHVGLIIRS